MNKDENLPIGALTIGEFKEILREEIDSAPKTKGTETLRKNYVYGLRGIQRLFGVSHKTAQYYKDHVIRDAVYQNGRNIVVDADLAMELFSQKRKR